MERVTWRHDARRPGWWAAVVWMVLAGGGAASWVSAQSIGGSVDAFVTAVGAVPVTSDGAATNVYDVGTLTMSVQSADDVLVGVTLDGTYDGPGITAAAAVLAVATGYGDGIEGGIASFLETRSGDLAGAGLVAVRVEAFVLNVDLREGVLGPGGTLRLIVPRIDPSRFGPPVATLGPDDATVVVREFSDFQCPFCQRFAFELLPGLKEGLLARGDVRFEFHHLPLETIHANAVPAAEASQCVADLYGNDAFWAYHDLVFARQAAWQSLGDPYPFLERLVLDLAPTALGDVSVATARDAVSDCLAQGDAREAVRAAMVIARDLQISATPTVFVGGLRLTDFGSDDAYASAIRLDAALARAADEEAAR